MWSCISILLYSITQLYKEKFGNITAENREYIQIKIFEHQYIIMIYHPEHHREHNNIQIIKSHGTSHVLIKVSPGSIQNMESPEYKIITWLVSSHTVLRTQCIIALPVGFLPRPVVHHGLV
jgi:hypothetical protein